MNNKHTSHHTINGARVTVRPIRPEDAELEKIFIRELTPQSHYSRFMSAINELTPKQLYYFTHNKSPKHIAYIATYKNNGIEIQIGVARYVLSDTDDAAEFAVVVADDWQKKGVATLLLHKLARYAVSAGIEKVKGYIMQSNNSMHTLEKN